MKQLFSVMAAALLMAGLALYAQTGSPNPTPGQGRGGAPHAYCDKNGDGLCDYTGLPVGQCREGNCPGCDGQCPRDGQGQGQGRGQGRGAGYGRNGGTCPRTSGTTQNGGGR
jgi:hypothetical protein